MADLLDVLQSSGPLSLNELNMRASETPAELVRKIQDLRKAGVVTVTGAEVEDISKLSPEDVAKSYDTVVELSWSGLRRSIS